MRKTSDKAGNQKSCLWNWFRWRHLFYFLFSTEGVFFSVGRNELKFFAVSSTRGWFWSSPTCQAPHSGSASPQLKIRLLVIINVFSAGSNPQGQGFPPDCWHCEKLGQFGNWLLDSFILSILCHQHCFVSAFSRTEGCGASAVPPTKNVQYTKVGSPANGPILFSNLVFQGRGQGPLPAAHDQHWSISREQSLPQLRLLVPSPILLGLASAT